MSLTVKFSGPWKQFGVLMKKAFITGKKTTSPAGLGLSQAFAHPRMVPAAG
jgi:hypothetical protein